MKGSFKILTVKGVALYLHLTLLFFVGWALVLYLVSGMHTPQLLWSLLFLSVLLATVFLHELGHAVVASFFGIHAKKIVLYPIGGIASIEMLPQNPGQELLISFAGPLVNLVVAFFCWIFSATGLSFLVYPQFDGTISASNFVSLLGLTNLLLAVFNLIPAFPLDGGRLLRAVLAFQLNYIRATAVVAIVSKVVAGVFILYGLFQLNFLAAVFGLFLLFYARAEEAYLQVKKLVQGFKVGEMLMYDYDHLDATSTVHEVAALLQQNHHNRFLVMNNGKPVGTINRIEIIKAIAEQHYRVRMTDLMKTDLQLLDADTPVESILDKLSSSEEKIYPVMSKGCFVGVINFHHVIEYLLLHTSRTKDFAKTKSLVELV